MDTTDFILYHDVYWGNTEVERFLQQCIVLSKDCHQNISIDMYRLFCLWHVESDSDSDFFLILKYHLCCLYSVHLGRVKKL
jgi:hypothetical protein